MAQSLQVYETEDGWNWDVQVSGVKPRTRNEAFTEARRALDSLELQLEMVNEVRKALFAAEADIGRHVNLTRNEEFISGMRACLKDLRSRLIGVTD